MTSERISELWKQAMQDIAKGFFQKSFVPGERIKGGDTVPQYFAHLLLAEVAAAPEGGALLDAAKELVASFEDADYTVTRRQNNAIGKLAGLVNPVPQAGNTHTAHELNVRDNSDSGTPADTGHGMNSRPDSQLPPTAAGDGEKNAR